MSLRSLLLAEPEDYTPRTEAGPLAILIGVFRSKPLLSQTHGTAHEGNRCENGSDIGLQQRNSDTFANVFEVFVEGENLTFLLVSDDSYIAIRKIDRLPLFPQLVSQLSCVNP